MLNINHNRNIQRHPHNPIINSFLKQQPLYGLQHRTFLIGTIIRGITRLPFLIFAGTVGGGYWINKKYSDITEAFPDLGRFKYIIPEKENINEFTSKLKSKFISIADMNRGIKDRITGQVSERYNSFENWLEEKSKQFKGEITANDLQDIETIIEIDKLKSEIDSSKLRKQENELLAKTKEELQRIQSQHEEEKRLLEDEVQELKRHLLLSRHKKLHGQSKIKKSLIEMYSDVLDELDQYDLKSSIQDKLPRIIVVGEQSAGKTSVLEMVAGARLFPRGSGAMMTRTPVKVTLAEGPYRVARFENDTTGKEYDLESEKGCADLRHEIECQMNQLAPPGSVADQPIGLFVRGPNLHRMVLVDLPGVISTVTTDLAQNTKDDVTRLTTQYMSNPNSIILCIQDGSKDAESSSIVDLVSKMDPTGKRTIFVMTKIDLALEQISNPDQIRDILSGKVFKMRARGYYGVIAGGDKSHEEDIGLIKQYEQNYFKKHTELFRDGAIKTSQMTTVNMSKAVSEQFWRMVRDSVEQQADHFRALKSNLENEWKHKYNNFRQLDRLELFEKAKGDILDNLVSLSVISPSLWEDKLFNNLWNQVKDSVFETVYFPAYEQYNSFGEYKTTLENCLLNWASNELTDQTITTGWQSMKQTLQSIDADNNSSLATTSSSKSRSNPDEALFAMLREYVQQQAFQRHQWDNKANSSLKIIQTEALNDIPIRSKPEWDEAVKFLSSSLDDYLSSIKKTKSQLKGPGFFKSFTGRNETQYNRTKLFDEFDNILKNEPNHKMNLSPDEMTTIKRNLQLKKINVESEFILETWKIAIKEFILNRAKLYAKDCQKGFYHYRYGFADSSNFDCKDVQLFYRLHRLLLTSSATLRNQIMNNEVQRMDNIVKEILDEVGNDGQKIGELLDGDRVKLAEKIKKVCKIQEKLEEFINNLNKEKTFNYTI